MDDNQHSLSIAGAGGGIALGHPPAPAMKHLIFVAAGTHLWLFIHVSLSINVYGVALVDSVTDQCYVLLLLLISKLLKFPGPVARYDGRSGCRMGGGHNGRMQCRRAGWEDGV
jgi:hypothetical protein